MMYRSCREDVAAEQAAPAPPGAGRETEHLSLGAAEHEERERLLLSAGTGETHAF